MTQDTAISDDEKYERKKSFLEDRSRRDTDRQHRWAMTLTLGALALALAAGALIARFAG